MILLSKALRYFVVTAQEESIQLAAAKLFITPSPLCRTIKSFEDIIGYRVFTRKKNGLVLTDYGRELLKTVLPLYEQATLIEKTYAKVKMNYTDITDNLKIGVDHQDNSYLSNVFSSHLLKESNFYISIEKFPPNEVSIDSLLRRNLYSAFFSFNEYECSSEVEHLKITVDEYKLAVAQNQINTETLSMEMLAKNTLVLLNHNPLEPEWLTIKNYFLKNKIKVHQITAQNINDQLTIIESGDAIGIIPDSARSIISRSDYKVSLLEFPFLEEGVNIERHVYFLKRNKKTIEKYILDPILRR